MKKLFSVLLVLALALSVLTVAASTEGNMVITAISDDPQQMDPTLNSYSRSSQVLQNLFKGLYKLDADGATVVPAIAESVNVMLPDERMRRVGQSVAAASLPEIR